MASNIRFSADYAKRAANCKKCKQQLTKGNLRIAKIVPNPFGSDGGDMKQYYHAKCLFETFEKARSTTKVVESPADIDQWAELEQSDKDDLLNLIKDLVKKRVDKKTKTPSPKKPAPPPAGQAKISDIFGADSKKTPAAKGEESDESEKSDESSPEDNGKSDSDDSWYEFCKLCSRIAQNSKYTAKTSIVKEFITKGSSKDKYRGDLYMLFKMLLPGVDQRVYNVKEKQLIKLFSQIFGSDPDEMTDHFNSCGEVSETIKTYFEKSQKFPSCKRSTLSIFDVDKWLDESTQYTREEDQQKHLTKIARKCTSQDLCMIIKEIKSDLRINAGAKHMLEALGSNAYEAFQASRNLKDVIDRILARQDGPSGMSKQLSIGITLGTPVLPMLAEACRSVEYAMKKCPNGMYAEIKYDGERVQLHKKGNDFHYFSRSLKPVQDHKIKHFKDWIPKAFPEGGDLILDAEVLMIDANTGKPLPFGTLGKHKKEAFSDANVCLFVFDCLLYQGKSLMHKSIKERKKILNEKMTEIPNRVMFSDMEFIPHGDKDKLRSMINKAINEGLEGLVLKDVGSVYEPGKRHWLKVKKDYLQEGAMADSADLIVLGAYFGTGNKGGMMSVFLMGCHDKKAGKFLTVTKCGNGHDDLTLDRINKELKSNMDKINKDYDKLPGWIRCARSLVPDFVVKDPKLAPIWEITGAEFSKSENHTADGISIRFPRVTKIRNDKDWEGATNLDELKKLFATSKEKTDFGEEESPKKEKAEASKSDEVAKVARGHSLNQLFAKWDESGAGEKGKNDREEDGSSSDRAESGKDRVADPKKRHEKIELTESNEKVTESKEKVTEAKEKVTESKEKVTESKMDLTESSSSSPRKRKKKEACRYGAKCYQKNPVHRARFSHPGDSDDDLDEAEKRPENPTPPKVARREPKLDLSEEIGMFAGVKAFFSPNVEDREKLIRLVNFYGGEVVNQYSLADATHIVTLESEKVEDGPKSAFRVSGNWLKDSVKKEKVQPVGEYSV